MKYEETPIKKTISKEVADKHKSASLEKFGTTALLWHIVKRHKFGLMTLYAVWLTALWAFPELPQLISAIFER